MRLKINSCLSHLSCNLVELASQFTTRTIHMYSPNRWDGRTNATKLTKISALTPFCCLDIDSTLYFSAYLCANNLLNCSRDF